MLLINPKEMAAASLAEGQIVSLVSDAEDGVEREVGGLKVTPFSLPDGCLGGYYPENEIRLFRFGITTITRIRPQPSRSRCAS